MAALRATDHAFASTSALNTASAAASLARLGALLLRPLVAQERPRVLHGGRLLGPGERDAEVFRSLIFARASPGP